MYWINIKDSQPKHNQTVLVSCPDDTLGQCCHVCEYIEYSNAFQIIAGNSKDYTCYLIVHGVTHWMPVPEKPIN